MEFETILYEVREHIATVTINRPERRNALNPKAYGELEQVFRVIQADEEVRCVVLTGADPAFCSGEDVKEMMTGEPQPQSSRLRAIRPGTTPTAVSILDCDRPIIAAVNGAAVGWGMDLSLFADIRLASENAVFSEIFVKRGLVTDLGGLWRLPKIVGPQRAAELLFTGDIINAHAAKQMGLILEVHAHDELLEKANELAGRIAANPPLAVRYLKEGLRRSFHGDYEDMGNWISQTLGVLFATEDHREGVKSFLEKRDPVFTGK
jgi:enoyl-CoA hydratase/carnithine racemase